MEPIDNKIFTGKEKMIIYSLLTRVMDADEVHKGEEISYLIYEIWKRIMIHRILFPLLL